MSARHVVATGLPEIRRGQAVQRRGIHVRHVRAVAGEGGGGDGAGKRRAGRQLCRGDGAAHVAGRAGKDGIGHGRKLLPGREGGESVGGIGADGDLQPIAAAGEDAGAKINRDGEQPVGDGGGAVGHRPGDDRAGGVGGEQSERQVIAAAGGAAIGIQPPLIHERRALRGGLMNTGEQRQHEE